jgi:hypothetical protein
MKAYFIILFLIVSSLFVTTFFDSSREKVLDVVKTSQTTKILTKKEHRIAKKIKVSDIKKIVKQSQSNTRTYERLNELVIKTKEYSYTDAQIEHKKKAEDILGIEFAPEYAMEIDLKKPAQLTHFCPDHLIKN